MTQLYIVKDLQQCGPYSLEEIPSLVDRGDFSWDDLAWHDGMEGWEPLQAVFEQLGLRASPDRTTVPSTEPQFHHVAPAKFVILSLITLGLYELYWFYRGWKYVKQQEGSTIWPFWRAFFAPVWFYPFARRVFGEGGRSGPAFVALLTAGYILVTVSWRLPDPYWLVSFGSILFALPLVVAVHRLNRAAGVTGASYRRFDVLHVMTSFVGLPLLAFTLATSLHFIPGAQVVEGKWVPKYHRKFLHEADILPEGETIVYFYSPAVMDYGVEGNFFTPQRVVSYWREGSDVYMEEALMSDVEEFHTNFSTSIIEPTTITVSRVDGSSFVLYVSADGERDRLFLDSLKQYWNMGRAVAEEQ